MHRDVARSGPRESALAESEEYAHVEQRLASLREEPGIETDDIEDVFDGAVPDIATTGVTPTVTGE